MTKFDFKNINIDDLKQKAKDLKRHKWCLITAGIVISLLGLYSMFHTGKAIISLAVFIGLGFIISGVSHILALYSHKSDTLDHPGWFMAQGVFEIILGFIMLSNLGVTAISIPLMVAFWAMFDGVMRTTASFQLKKAGIENWWRLLLFGIISILFALILLSHPFAGFIAATFLLGITFFVWGITVIFETFHFYDMADCGCNCNCNTQGVNATESEKETVSEKKAE